MTGDCHVRFCERRGVQLPPATHQAIRPAVVNRKVWGGNRTRPGADAQQILMSVLHTATKQGHDPITVMTAILLGQPTPLTP